MIFLCIITSIHSPKIQYIVICSIVDTIIDNAIDTDIDIDTDTNTDKANDLDNDNETMVIKTTKTLQI